MTEAPAGIRRGRAPALAMNLLARLAVLGLVALTTFALPRLLPGDPLQAMLASDHAQSLSLAELAALRERLGLTAGWGRQLGDWLGDLLRGDLGHSIRHARPVAALVAESLPWTLLLILGAMPVYLLLGALAGIRAGRAQGGALDRGLTGLVTVLASIPPFVLAILLMLGFAILWPVLPAGGALPLFPSDQPLVRAGQVARHAALPVAALALHEFARFYYLARAEAIGLSRRPFVLNAEARGLAPLRMLADYYGRNILPAFVARMSDSISGLFGAALIVEIVFSYPGIGGLIYGAILDRDYPLLQGATIIVAAGVLALNWLIDAVLAVLAERG
ncbi:ABC transporter permease [Paracoccus denitrificans]|jgi:peptide/nickel transport system permease protein|uniref:ABC transporter permease n=1 Tax=Paracoccus denitrificans TaxID=266 RepID=UPI000886ACD2|nr:ABC transporter permease [Paracoccus denitrificans]MCU7431349.1 ABC transporter permease [Paracoccus denitrificans]UPV93992.1 ABC transporter permease [Paracoccus denitrificans]WQO33970.1 ABC transporter permease [Paracoccus denitrificans]SDJ45311.1 peptide/nickel transport system permease protein [Paracoccus denitrificans]SFR18674.1 peptide/nickel transport system permease protein [Paracoccus denitrificans]